MVNTFSTNTSLGKNSISFGELIALMVPVVSSFFTFSPHLLKIAGMLPMVCHFVTRIVPE
ncbi:hypothetical protein Hanom_Chr13g01233791 [Helianthus anomalus]